MRSESRAAMRSLGISRARPERIGRDVLIDHALLSKRRRAARSHGRRDRQRADELLPTVRDSPSRLRPEALAVGICEQDARNEVRIEGVDAVAEGVQDRLQRTPLDDQFQRVPVDDRQRVADPR